MEILVKPQAPEERRNVLSEPFAPEAWAAQLLLLSLQFLDLTKVRLASRICARAGSSEVSSQDWISDEKINKLVLEEDGGNYNLCFIAVSRK